MHESLHVACNYALVLDITLLRLVIVRGLPCKSALRNTGTQIEPVSENRCNYTYVMMVDIKHAPKYLKVLYPWSGPKRNINISEIL